MRHAVRVHDAGPTQLQVRRVHLAAEEFVERLVAREDHGRRLDLDHAAAEPSEVRADADGAARHDRRGEGRVARAAHFAGDQPAARQTLDAEAAACVADDVRDDVVQLAVGRCAWRALDDAWPQRAERRVVQVQVLEAMRGVVVDKLGAEQVDELWREAQACAAVGRHIQERDALGAGQAAHLREEGVFGRAKRARVDGHVVREQQERPTVGELGRLDAHAPRDHTERVVRGRPHGLHEADVGRWSWSWSGRR